MSCLVTPALARATLVESMSRSSAPLSQCSPKRVQPIPTMATRSLIPCELMLVPLLGGGYAARSCAPPRSGRAFQK